MPTASSRSSKARRSASRAARARSIPTHPQGLFFRDTRFVSELRLTLNGTPPEPLAATTTDPFSAVFVLRGHPSRGRADSHLVVFRRRYIGRGMREDIEIENFGEEAAFCSIELVVDADFADLFEVKEGRVHKQGKLGVPDDGSGRITFTYERSTFTRATHVDFTGEPRISGSHVHYEVIVPPRGRWSACMQVTPVIGEHGDHAALPVRPAGRALDAGRSASRSGSARLPVVSTDDDQFRALLDRSTQDVAGLRIFDPEFPDRAVVAAGAPWFMTLFGRDSLITSWMTMLVDPDLALGTLQTLARFQGDEGRPAHRGGAGPHPARDALRRDRVARARRRPHLLRHRRRDAAVRHARRRAVAVGQPARRGRRAAPGGRPRARVDHRATATRTATATSSTSARPTAACRTRVGRTPGTRCASPTARSRATPIALCEVQGYVYAALDRACALRDRSRRPRRSRRRCATRADELKRRFNEDFWVDTADGGYFAMGLDRDKRPIDGVGSNMGHCLWTGIVDEEKAPLVARPLLSDGDVQRVGHPHAVERRPAATTRSRTTAAACGRTTTRSAPPGSCATASSTRRTA